jgi:hypothetical protein
VFHVGYLYSIMPSFGLGGTVTNQEAGFGYQTPLFHSRHFYTSLSAVYRDNAPLAETDSRPRLRSFRWNSTFGWAPHTWVRLEGFYGRIAQTSLLPGGRMNRNRIGFQLVTSRPVRWR